LSELQADGARRALEMLGCKKEIPTMKSAIDMFAVAVPRKTEAKNTLPWHTSSSIQVLDGRAAHFGFCFVAHGVRTAVVSGLSGSRNHFQIELRPISGSRRKK
jgi:hypothetical protein